MKILADTSVWWVHVVRAKPPDPLFAGHLLNERIVAHPWVYGELLLAGLAPSIGRDLLALEIVPVAPQADVERFIRQYRPQGIGWVDVNLLVSCIEADAVLWTRDRDLAANAAQHGRAFTG